MSKEYRIGDLSNLLQSRSGAAKPGTDKDERLQSLFTSKPPQVAETQAVTTKTFKKLKEKRKLEETVITNEVLTDKSEEKEVPLKKKLKHSSDFSRSTDRSNDSSPHKHKKKGKKLKDVSLEKTSEEEAVRHSPGFNPPAGIVHESFFNSKKKKNKKRKIPPSSDSEDEDETKKGLSEESEVKKKGTRPRRDKMAKETDHRTIFVGNLPLTVKKKKLMNLLKNYGAIESIRYRCFAPNDPKMKKRVVAIKQNLHPERHNCVVYVKFMKAESAKKALKCNGREMDGFHLRVDMAARDQVRDIKKSVFIGNLPFDIEEESVRSHFADCGNIDNVRIVRDSKTSLGKGFCYVIFSDKDAVAFALRLNGSKLAGREVRVMQCLSNPKKSSLERGKDKSFKVRKQNKKEAKSQSRDSEPFHVIDATKLDGDVDQDEDETPKKMTFAEKFEKKKQKRFEKGKLAKKDTEETETENKSASDVTNSGIKSKNKNEGSKKKHKRPKFKKTDSRTGSDRSKIFGKSPKKLGNSAPKRTKTFNNKTNTFIDKKSLPAKHIKFNESGESVHKKTVHTPKGSKNAEFSNKTETKAKHIFFD